MSFDPVTAITDLVSGVGGKLIDRIWPDPNQAAAAKVELLKLQQSGELARIVSDNDLTKAYLLDQQNARARDVAFLQAGKKNQRGDILAYAAVGALAGCILALFAVAIFNVRIDTTVKELLLLLTGALI